MNKPSSDEEESAAASPSPHRDRWKPWIWIGLLAPLVAIAIFCYLVDFAVRSGPDDVTYTESESIQVTEDVVEEAVRALPNFAGFTDIEESMIPHNRDGFGSDDHASFSVRAHISSDVFSPDSSEDEQRNEFALLMYEDWVSHGYEVSQSDGWGEAGGHVRAQREDGVTLVFDSSVETMVLTVDTGWVELSPLRQSSSHPTYEWSPNLDHLRHPESADE